MFALTCTMKFWQACRNFVGKNTKNNPKFQKRWIKIFLNKMVYFHQKRFLSNGECSFDNASKKFLLRIPTFAAQIPKTTEKNMDFLKRK